ncbi:sunset domain-containing protein [Cutibacterium sp. V947]|uniref:sunset domain-containing protein n=1 Tax=Cutibacterium sp. V947 TaxID=3446480 RepID=UPI003EE411A6
MSCKKKASRKTAAASSPSTLKEQRAQALEIAAAYLTAAQDKAAPLAAQVNDKIGPLTDQLSDKIGPISEKLGPISDQAVEAGKKALDVSKEYTQDKVVPALHQAYDTFQKDVLPGLEERAERVAAMPAVEEATRRGQAAVSALKGESTELAAKAGVETTSVKKAKHRSKLGKVLGTLAVLGGISAAAVVAGRRFMSSSDDGWTAHEPKVTYSWTPGDKGKATDKPAPKSGDKPEPKTDGTSVPADPVAAMANEGGPAAAAPETTAETTEAPEEGTKDENSKATSYVGENPPKEYVIKGNDRSMKYHVPGSGGYDRTIADVWFATEEAAQAAGFTKAQR